MNELKRHAQIGEIPAKRMAKMAKLRPFLRQDMPFVMRGDKVDYLSDELRGLAGVEDTEAVSSHGYDPYAMALVEKYTDGLLLDCGAGRRNVYFPNVVNFEIVDYDTTDVLGVGEELPFSDDSFDAVFSLSVLEHVKDPFRCAREIARVLKPGGDLYCVVPFLQPLHGYPHHYYNMTHEGLRTLFENTLEITRQEVLASTGPIWTLTWIAQRWAAQLPPDARERFLSLRMSDLLVAPQTLLQEPWVNQLPHEARFELASATAIFAQKRAGQ